MDDLIAALTIFAKYQKPTKWPTICAHELLYIVGVDRIAMTAEDAARVEALGFFWEEKNEVWASIRFGSA